MFLHPCWPIADPVPVTGPLRLSSKNYGRGGSPNAPAGRLWRKGPEKARPRPHLAHANAWSRRRFHSLRPRRSSSMRSLAVRAVAASLLAIVAAGCTTTGIGTGQSTTGNTGATFSWTSTGATRGTMIAQLSDGRAFQGPFFQVTQESVLDDYGPLWNGWGPGYGWHQPFSRYGWGWDGWGPWGPYGD